MVDRFRPFKWPRNSVDPRVSYINTVHKIVSHLGIFLPLQAQFIAFRTSVMEERSWSCVICVGPSQYEDLHQLSEIHDITGILEEIKMENTAAKNS